ncbi:MAG: DUF3014 domain-containing protein [Gammaproteobacteria bacterium]|jgi:hypothetical protein|nr:DUF3014 domain-containing protein [Gammaproteobacteria bacterium]
MSENRPVILALVVVGLLIGGLVFYMMTSSEAGPKPAVSKDVAIPVAEPVKNDPISEPEPDVSPIASFELPVEEETEAKPAFVLPLLNDSDQLIRDGIVSLTRHEGINRWLSSNEIVRKFVAFVDGVANGQAPKDPVRVLAPEEPFLARQISEDVYELDEASYARYNSFVEIIVSMDARRTAEFYFLVSPLLKESYSELGYPDKKFDDSVFRAIGRLLETPVLTEPIRLVRPVVMYEFEDKKLESLSAAQKQLIRMGPKNTRRLQAKLSEIALELRAILENR